MADHPERNGKGDLRKTVVGGTALLLGAAGLFMFIVGLKRRHRLDTEREVALTPQRGGAREWTDATARHEVDSDDEREEA